jgi:hypothetical protein
MIQSGVSRINEKDARAGSAFYMKLHAVSYAVT